MRAATSMITIAVNGVDREVEEGTSIEQLLGLLGVRRELVAVEMNQRLVRRVEHATCRLSAGDRVEVVEFVGGG